MTWPIVILPPAELELADAVAWYESREPHLGIDFVDAFDDACRRIALQPESYQRLADSGFRQVVMRRFPFVVVFELRQSEVRVLALAHGSRRPGYWLAR